MNELSEVPYVLHAVLIDIRETTNIKKSQILDDVVHNFPMMLRSGRIEEEIVAEIMCKAERTAPHNFA